jgi:hypothetical protein
LENRNCIAQQRRRLIATGVTGVTGGDVKCRETVLGEVENLVIDHASWLALVINPEEAFLGLNVTIRLVPVSVADPAANDVIYLDATVEMILQSRAAPKIIADWNTNWKLESLYNRRAIDVYEQVAVCHRHAGG